MAFKKKIDFASLSKRGPKADNKTIIASAPRDFADAGGADGMRRCRRVNTSAAIG